MILSHINVLSLSSIPISTHSHTGGVCIAAPTFFYFLVFINLFPPKIIDSFLEKIDSRCTWQWSPFECHQTITWTHCGQVDKFMALFRCFSSPFARAGQFSQKHGQMIHCILTSNAQMRATSKRGKHIAILYVFATFIKHAIWLKLVSIGKPFQARRPNVGNEHLRASNNNRSGVRLTHPHTKQCLINGHWKAKQRSN